MMVTAIVFLLFAGFYLGLLILLIVLAVNAKTTAVRIGSIVVGLFLLLILPLAILSATYTFRSTSSRTSEPHFIEQSSSGVTAGQREQVAAQGEDAAATLSENVPVPPAPSITPAAPPPPSVIPRSAVAVEASGRAAGAWRTADTDLFRANVYPSFEAAIKPLLLNLRPSLLNDQLNGDQLIPEEPTEPISNPEAIYVTAIGESIEPLRSTMIAILEKEFPTATVKPSQELPAKVADNEMSVLVHKTAGTVESASWDYDVQVQHVTLACEATSGSRHTTVQCFVTEKPWVESWDRFVSMHPKRSFLVGYSRELHSSEGQARKDAVADAVRQVSMTVGDQSYQLIDERHMIDRFAQQLSRPYGEVWREAVLFEMPDPQQVDVARTTAAEAFQRSWIGTMLQRIGVVIFFLVTIVLCWTLNWMTQGYYRSQVVLGFTGVMLLGALFALALVA